MDRVIAAGAATLASIVWMVATAVTAGTQHLVGAQIDDGLINTVLVVALGTCITGVGFTIKFLLDMKFWQGGIERRVSELEDKDDDNERERPHHDRR